jgi:hypothetical protein
MAIMGPADLSRQGLRGREKERERERERTYW